MSKAHRTPEAVEQRVRGWMDRGFSFFPLHGNTKRPAVKSWKEYQERRPKESEVKAWLMVGHTSWAIVTGAISGIVVIDVDSDDALAEVEKLGITPGPGVTTRKGRHLYFQHPSTHVGNAAGLGGISNLDVRGDGGYVVAPFSLHETGHEYTPFGWAEELPPYPAWAMELAKKKLGSVKETSIAYGSISEGGRNNSLFKIACSMRGQGCGRGTIMDRLLIENRRCEPPVTEKELADIVDSAMKHEPDKEKLSLTDKGNAQRLVAMFGHELRHVNQIGWHAWTGTRWKPDEKQSVEFAKATTDAMLKEVPTIVDPDERKAMFKHAYQSESANRIFSMVKLASSDPEISVEAEHLDADPWALNCRNGVLDLKTGGFRAHRGHDLFTKEVPIVYDPVAECPRWLQFLDEITDGDMELIDYIQRVVGYTLTGSTKEHVWFVLLGDGSNGKSTFLRVMHSMMGLYAQVARSEMFLLGRSDSIPNDVAALRGARFVHAAETPFGRRLNEALIKQLTGDDQIQARFLHKEFFHFTPQMKLFLATNYRPNIGGADEGIWRRTREIPFRRSFTGDQIDYDLTDKLLAEMPGILAWAARGCLAWLDQGLGMPPVIKESVRAYKNDMDLLGEFAEDWCESGPGFEETVGDLYNAYVAWCSSVGERPESRKMFGQLMERKGFTSFRNKAGVRARRGVRLRAVRMGVYGDQWKLPAV